MPRNSKTIGNGDRTGIQVRWRTWLEKDGRPFFGDGRARLLQAVAAHGSLAAAARELHMSYRTAWAHMNAIERGFDRKLVVRRTGGKEGGGCQLTETAKRFLESYQMFRSDMDRMCRERFQLCAGQIGS